MRKLILISFLVFSIVSLLTLFTPFRFENVHVRSIVFFLAIALCYPAARYTGNEVLRVIARLLPIGILLFLLIGANFIPLQSHFNEGWQTVWISHRKSTHPGIYVGEQRLDLGARGYASKIVKVTPLTPLFSWTVTADTTKLDTTWKRVHESYNPFQLKGG